MAKNNDTLLVVGAIIFAAIFLGNGANSGITTGATNGVDLCGLVESEVSLTGQRQFLAGTQLTAEWARIIKVNGDNTVKDKGQVSLNSGTSDTNPEGKYKIYFGENSSTYYTHPKDYTAPCKDATDDIAGNLCTIDTTPTLTFFDEFGRPSTATSIAAGDVKDVSVRVKVSADECYGNPNAPGKNAICLKYNSSSTGYTSVKASTPTQDTPYLIASGNATTGYAIDCYELDLLKDTEFQDITVTLKAADNFVYSTGQNVSVTINDIAFDLDADTLDEIWGFEDEDNNELGTTAQAGLHILLTA